MERKVVDAFSEVKGVMSHCPTGCCNFDLITASLIQ